MDKSVLTFREYNIAGNVLRAYYDADDKLVFVLDSTLDDRKPNALLVINPVGDRKWDDILANDYGVDLETVRPKKNNKYQKLDIEYAGLAEYDNLINAYETGGDLADALAELASFREESVRRAATERLAVANDNAEKARETIIKTRESISELQTKLRQLRAKLAQQKKQVGREPTKKSASKILRTDAQVDATNEKLRRAKKRLNNAQRRLIAADQDAEIARGILEQKNTVADVEMKHGVARPRPSAVEPIVTTTYNVSYDDVTDNDNGDDDNGRDDEFPDSGIHFSTQIDMSPNNNIVAAADANDDNNVARMPDTEFDIDDNLADVQTQIADEPKAETMADEPVKNEEEVKPLFDNDPEILDEEIAFKPINFGVSSPVPDQTAESQPSADVYETVVDEKPLAFTPPVDDDKIVRDSPINVRPVTDEFGENTGNTNSGPVLDTIKSVEMPVDNNDSNVQLDSELMSGVAPIRPDVESEPVPVRPEPVARPMVNENNMGTPAPAPVAPDVNAGARPVPPAATLSNAAAAARPMSPITGNAAPTNPAPRKPTWIYYVMLILLIGLSIFTLWLYQKNTNQNVPDLTATVPTVQESEQTSPDVGSDIDSPFIAEMDTSVSDEKTQITVDAPVAEPVEPVTVTEPVVEPEPVPEPEPVETVSEPVVTEPEPVADIEITSIDMAPIKPVAEPEPVIETEEEILASKPAYNVSQNENMFVASPEYDTETLRQNAMQAVDTVGPSVVTSNDVANANVNVPTTPSTNVTSGGAMNAAPVVLQNQQVPVATSNTVEEYVPQAVTSVVWEDTVQNLPTCPDGTAPDVNGCCAGEVYTDMGEMGFNCCPETGGDCFPPLL